MDGGHSFASREPREIAGFNYERIINSIDWNRVLIEAQGLHEKLQHSRMSTHHKSVCGPCIKEVLLKTEDGITETSFINVPPTINGWIIADVGGGGAGGRGSFGVIAHMIGVTDTAESIMANEKIVRIECGNNLVALKQFSRTTEAAEMDNWVTTILEEHNKTCPLVQEQKGE